METFIGMSESVEASEKGAETAVVPVETREKHTQRKQFTGEEAPHRIPTATQRRCLT
jgi:hypothetical protein